MSCSKGIKFSLNRQRCQICRDNIVYKRLGRHIVDSHNLTCQEYFDTYTIINKEQNHCERCGKLTQFDNLTIGYRKYCSNQCSSLEQDKIHLCGRRKDKWELRKCKSCDKFFDALKTSKKLHCTQKCYYDFRKEQFEILKKSRRRICEWCGIEHYKVSNDRFCSNRCKGEWHSKTFSGKNNPFYGKTHDKRVIERMIATKIKNGTLHNRYRPTSIEKQFLDICDKHNLPYKYVGDGSFIIGRLNPDFVNTNGEKIAIEVYVKYFKKKTFGNIDKWKKERQLKMGKYGWKIVYFDENEINEDVIKNRLGEL